MIKQKIETQIGINLLRTNNVLYEGDKQIKGINFNTTFFDFSQKVISLDKIQEAKNHLLIALEAVNKLSDLTKDKDLLKIRLYHQIAECYELLEDDNNYIKICELGASEGDLKSIYFLIEYYSRSNVFPYEKIIGFYNNFVRISFEILAKQKRDGVESYKNTVEKGKIDIKKIALARDYEHKEMPILSTLKFLVKTLLAHSYFDKALEIAESLKNDYTEFAFWDTRYENEINSDFKQWKKLVDVNKNEIVPTATLLNDYFSQETIKKMDNSIKIFVGTSLYVFKSLETFNEYTVDYSPSIIPLFKSLESIMYKITIDGYFHYIEENRTKYKEIFAPKSIYNREENVFSLPRSFDFGIGLGILCYWKIDDKGDRYVYKFNTGVIDFLKTSGVVEAEINIKNFCESIEKCRIYRNITAHKDRVYKTVAMDAKAIILDTVKIIETSYQLFGNLLT